MSTRPVPAEDTRSRLLAQLAKAAREMRADAEVLDVQPAYCFICWRAGEIGTRCGCTEERTPFIQAASLYRCMTRSRRRFHLRQADARAQVKIRSSVPREWLDPDDDGARTIEDWLGQYLEQVENALALALFLQDSARSFKRVPPRFQKAIAPVLPADEAVADALGLIGRALEDLNDLQLIDAAEELAKPLCAYLGMDGWEVTGVSEFTREIDWRDAAGVRLAVRKGLAPMYLREPEEASAACAF